MLFLQLKGEHLHEKKRFLFQVRSTFCVSRQQLLFQAHILIVFDVKRFVLMIFMPLNIIQEYMIIHNNNVLFDQFSDGNKLNKGIDG